MSAHKSIFDVILIARNTSKELDILIKINSLLMFCNLGLV
jgi:hypothetical protein